jgi:hypothetical protein
VHIHPNQTIPNTEMNSLYAAEKAAAKREVERTRNKLLGFGYEVREQRGRKRRPGSGKQPNENAELKPEAKSVSDWA